LYTGERLRLPNRAQFPRSANLEVYSTVLGASPDLRVEFRIGPDRVIPKKLAVFPGEIPQSYEVALLDLQVLEPRNHTLKNDCGEHSRAGY
jgi:hypothetical protein